MASTARIAFAGTPEFAVPALEAIARAGFDIPLVLTQPDRPSGRGQAERASPVKRAALARGLELAQPARLDDPGLAARLGPPPALLVVVAYGLLLPAWLLEWPGIAAVNVHASLLPRWRGAAPIQRAILAGDATSGVSIMKMDEGLDTGPVYASAGLELDAAETGGSLHDRLAALGASTLARALPGILDGSRVPRPQPSEGATYAAKLTKSEARLDFSASAAELERRVRAFDPWPVAEARLSDGRRLRIWRAEALASPGAHEALAPSPGGPEAPGTILRAGAGGIDVATGEGVLRLIEIQVPSARRMPAAAWLAAHSLEGTHFDRG